MEAKVQSFTKRRKKLLLRGEQEKESEETACSAAEQSQEQEREETEIINELEITQSLSLSELRDMWKDYGHQPGEQIITWLLKCWDIAANSQ